MNDDSSSEREYAERGVQPSRPRRSHHKILQQFIFRHSVPALQSYGCWLRPVNWALVWCSLWLKCTRGPRFYPAEPDWCWAAVPRFWWSEFFTINVQPLVVLLQPRGSSLLFKQPLQQNKTKRLFLKYVRSEWNPPTCFFCVCVVYFISDVCACFSGLVLHPHHVTRSSMCPCTCHISPVRIREVHSKPDQLLITVYNRALKCDPSERSNPKWCMISNCPLEYADYIDYIRSRYHFEHMQSQCSLRYNESSPTDCSNPISPGVLLN